MNELKINAEIRNSAKMRKNKRWEKWEIDYLYENLHIKTMLEICTHLNRNERSVKLYLHRHRYDSRNIVKDNLLIRILTLQFKDPTLFIPNRAFLEKVKIGQKRYWQLYKGIKQMTDDECKRIVEFFGIPYESIQDIRQTSLFTNI